ncbi:uncharacterized protein LOC110421357 [Herrania umbratica]|uniref:Uncharacterized protein LOC110421357 n=1 Tax=Herrania umbratica TaxID=108875 RepID=A0A6J1AW39_9ROSI|nr:uncharacterized protein LOC110421357 [Herrania umbratica]
MAHQIFFLVSLLALATLHGMDAVDYAVTNQAAATPGGIVFNNQLGVEYTRQQMQSASEFIWNLFQQTDPQDGKRNSIPTVSLFVVDTLPPQIPAATSNNEIQVSDKHIEAFSGDQLKPEFNGVLYHEMTHVWQWNGNGQQDETLGGLIEGIADFVRLKANYVPAGWAQPGQGDKWYDGYSVTARFLDYCEGLRPGFVAELNRKMRDGYSTDFFSQLLGKTVDQLWSDYKNQPRN